MAVAENQARTRAMTELYDFDFEKDLPAAKLESKNKLSLFEEGSNPLSFNLRPSDTVEAIPARTITPAFLCLAPTPFENPAYQSSFDLK